MRRMAVFAVSVAVAIVVLTGAYVTTLLNAPDSTSTTTASSGALISVSGMTLCASDCIYPAPYASALVNFSSDSPVSTLKVYVNSTYDGIPLQNPNNMTHYAYLWKGSIPASFIPVVKGDTYVFEFVVVYQDGKTGSAYAQTVASTSTVVTTTACSPAANQENPLLTFRVDVEYSGPWNATATGYSNSTANQAFLRCYSGNGNGWILISDWNPNGSAILSLTIQKMDAGSGNLTAIGGGQEETTVAPYGTVTISLTAVP